MAASFLDLAALLPSWRRALRAANKSPATIDAYSAGVTAFLKWCDRTGTAPVLDRAVVSEFIADLLAGGAEPATAHLRLKGLRRFSAWLADEGELDSDPLLGIKPPKVDAKVTAALTDEQLRALIDACRGKTLKDKRDEAIVRLMLETGLRAGEVIGLKVADVDLDAGAAVVRKGKGGKGRVVPFGPQTVAALDRYLRARRQHHHPEGGNLWVAARGRASFGYDGVDITLRARAKAAGIAGFHLHLLRHTFATRWLRAEGSEGGLMAVAGWVSRAQLDRYTAASASERAATEARGLNLGEL